MGPRRACACEGHTLDRLLQPTVMAFLANAPMHGYSLLEQLRESPLMSGSKPDPTGLYRMLNAMEGQGVVRHHLTESERGPAKRIYELTPAGRKCLVKWVQTLDDYQCSVAKLVKMMRKTGCEIAD